LPSRDDRQFVKITPAVLGLITSEKRFGFGVILSELLSQLRCPGFQYGSGLGVADLAGQPKTLLKLCLDFACRRVSASPKFSYEKNARGDPVVCQLQWTPTIERQRSFVVRPCRQLWTALRLGHHLPLPESEARASPTRDCDISGTPACSIT
jgi:hypothetical protein